MIQDEIKLSDLKFKPEDSVDCTTLTKLAIDYSDGIIQASQTINPDIQTYAQSAGIPFLPYQNSETYIDAYNDFYDVVWENANK